jgi:hypothetical protein
VEWFTNRGKNYEYNIRVIDKHLKQLVSSDKVPRVHTVFHSPDQVEFRPRGNPEDQYDLLEGFEPFFSNSVN